MAPSERLAKVEVVGSKPEGRAGSLNSFMLTRGNEKLGRWFGLRAGHRVVDSGSRPLALWMLDTWPFFSGDARRPSMQLRHSLEGPK